jgi:hypothetical protein
MDSESLTGFRTKEHFKLEGILEFLRKRREGHQEDLDDDREVERLMNRG